MQLRGTGMTVRRVQQPPVEAVASVNAKEGQRTARSFDSAELFGNGTEIEIVHNQAVYTLKITRQGKLILNK
jgi:hemin uptake protein HemP